MKEWGATPSEGMSVDYSSHLPKIKQHYAQLFKERFYFVRLPLLYPRFFVINCPIARRPDPFGGLNLSEAFRL
jgi:hypothetical protein